MNTDRKAVAAPKTRRERRAAQRAERGTQRTTKQKAVVWRSPMVILTVAALAVGAIVIGLALASGPSAPTETLTAPIAAVPAGLSNGRALGSPDAPVTVDVWADFQCPGCMQLATRVEPPIVSQLVVPGYAQIVFHDAAFQGRNVTSSWDESVQSAAAARCAADQDRFWEMHDWLFTNWDGENMGGFRPARLRQIAESAELDMTAYDGCMAVGDKQSAVNAETDLATADGVQQTPTILLNGVEYTGQLTVKDLGDAIMAAAAGASPAPAAFSDAAPWTAAY